MQLSKAHNISKKLKNELSRNKGILEKFPLQRYVDYLETYPRILDYNCTSPEVKNYCADIVDSSDLETLEIYHRLLICDLIVKSTVRLERENLPQDVKTLYIKNFNRILEDLAKDKSRGEYLHPKDKFMKNLAISNLRLIPMGARKINLSVLPVKNFMFRKGLRQLLAVIFYVGTELKGIKPLYIGHLDTNDPELVTELNSEGLKKTYLRIVDMLKVHKDVKGYFGTSWLLDPQLDRINQRHKYARSLVTQNGGKLYYKGPSEVALKNALATSKTRRRLYEEGKYVPTDYVIVWSRQKLIRWAEKIKHT